MLPWSLNGSESRGDVNAVILAIGGCSPTHVASKQRRPGCPSSSEQEVAGRWLPGLWAAPSMSLSNHAVDISHPINTFLLVEGRAFSDNMCPIPRLPMLTLVTSPSFVNSRFFSPLSAGTGSCGDFLCMPWSQRSILVARYVAVVL